MALTLRIGGETSFLLLPPADGVRVQLTEIKENKFRSTAVDFCFQLADPEYSDGPDEDVDAAIQSAAAGDHKHFETMNIPDGPLGKNTKLYKMLKGMNGGRDIDEGDDIDLEPFVGAYFLADFEHVQKQRMVGQAFEKVYDEKGQPVYKAAIVKIRPEKKAKAPRKPAPPPVPTDDDPDADLYQQEI